jgi:hypothetical protein
MTGINDPAHWSGRIEHWAPSTGSQPGNVVDALGGRGYIW